MDGMARLRRRWRVVKWFGLIGCTLTVIVWARVYYDYWWVAREFTPHAFFVKSLAALLLPCAISTAAVWWYDWRDRRRIPPGHCRKCGYDLTGNVTGVCSECGKQMSAPSATEG